MTDDEIIKALKYCSTDVRENTCPKCAFYKKNRCSTLMLNGVSDLINRQKAEIERLKNKNTLLLKKKCKDVNTARKIIKSEAMRDFAKRLKSKLNNLEFRTKTHRKTVPTKFCDDNANWVMHECVPEEIDKLVREMTEAGE